MNRTTATCIAGMTSKTTSTIRIHFFPRPREAKPFTRFTRFTRRFLAFGVGIFAKRLRWRPERNPLYFKLCESTESVIFVTFTMIPHDDSSRNYPSRAGNCGKRGAGERAERKVGGVCGNGLGNLLEGVK
jgi:hypothetical protein